MRSPLSVTSTYSFNKHSCSIDNLPVVVLGPEDIRHNPCYRGMVSVGRKKNTEQTISHGKGKGICIDKVLPPFSHACTVYVTKQCVSYSKTISSIYLFLSLVQNKGYTMNDLLID